MQAQNERETPIQRESVPLAFVLMPFEPEFDDIYENLIKPALEDTGYDVQRADSTFDQQNILRNIVHNIDRASLIVAELTSSNPNVFYELGIAHGLLKPVVLLSQNLDEVPFDLRSYNIVTYSTHYREVQQLKDSLYEIAQRTKEGTVVFGSPVSDFAPSVNRTLSTIDVSTEPTKESEPANEAEEDELGTLDFAEGMESSVEKIGEYVSGFQEAMERFGQEATEQATAIESFSKGGSVGRFARIRQAGKAMASVAIEFAESVESDLPGLRDAWEQLEENFTQYMSSALSEDDDENRAAETRSHLEELRKAVAETSAELSTARNQIAENRGISKDLNLAIRRTVGAIDGLIEELTTGESRVYRMINILDEQQDEELEDSLDLKVASERSGEPTRSLDEVLAELNE